MQKLSGKNLLLVGFTLFSMFFGAGNLIFPPHLGAQAGTSLWPAFAGLAVSAVGLPIAGVVAVARAGGLDKLAGRVHPVFAMVFTILVYLSIGPCLAIPRTASTSFQMLVPRCPVCGAPMTMNLRIDDSFVQDDGWYCAMNRYREFLERHESSRILCLELGVGFNTPGIIKYPFWRMTAQNPKATYVCVNKGQVYAPKKIAERSLCLDADIGNFLRDLKSVSFADGQGGC